MCQWMFGVIFFRIEHILSTRCLLLKQQHKKKFEKYVRKEAFTLNDRERERERKLNWKRNGNESHTRIGYSFENIWWIVEKSRHTRIDKYSTYGEWPRRLQCRWLLTDIETIIIRDLTNCTRLRDQEEGSNYENVINAHTY